MARKMDWSLAEELTKKTQEEIEKIEKVHILVVGKTGVGKSTLINNIFRERLAETGIGQPITICIKSKKKACQWSFMIQEGWSWMQKLKTK